MSRRVGEVRRESGKGAAVEGRAIENGSGPLGQRHLFGKVAFRCAANSKGPLKRAVDVALRQLAALRYQRVAMP